MAVSSYPLVFSTCTLGAGGTTFEYCVAQVTVLVISEKVPPILTRPRVKASMPTPPDPADSALLSPANLYCAPNLKCPTVFSYLRLLPSRVFSVAPCPPPMAPASPIGEYSSAACSGSYCSVWSADKVMVRPRSSEPQVGAEAPTYAARPKAWPLTAPPALAV